MQAGDGAVQLNPEKPMQSEAKAAANAGDNLRDDVYGDRNKQTWSKVKDLLVGKDHPMFKDDGKDKAREEVTNKMPADQQERVKEQEKAYNRAWDVRRTNTEQGTAMTKAEAPDLADPKYKDLKAREDAVAVKEQVGLEKAFKDIHLPIYPTPAKDK